jgi:alanyl-tRNA synthetase
MKEELRKYFSENWKIFYDLEFFREKGFKRQKCQKCNKYFWSIEERKYCADPSCSGYSFIGKKREDIDYIEAWKKIEKFFIKNGHTSIKRYPVVCRWFPDLYFVVASVVNFYRKENGNIYFELPADKVIVPQFCLRFNDLENVGISGRHYCCFIMIGQHTIPEKNGYWKEETIRLDFEMLKEFGIKDEEIVFIEDVWIGSRAFGSCLEYFVDGLELGNAVFTEFEIVNNSFRKLNQRFVDMGAGLERFPWLLTGNPASYFTTFEPQIKYIKNFIDFDYNFLKNFYSISGYFDLTEIDENIFYQEISKRLGIEIKELKEKVFNFSSIFKILDFLRALLIAVNDGALPSNTGGNYNLRIILRKILNYNEKFNFDLMKIAEITSKQLEYFDDTLKESLDTLQKIIEIEKKKYKETKERAKRILSKYFEKELTKEELKMLYESHGITPEIIEEVIGKKVDKSFIEELRIKKERKKEERKIDVSNIPPTEILYYNDIYEFEAKVLKVDKNFVILDRTAFFPEQGGQKCDLGFIENLKVKNVFKIGKVIVHEVENCNLKENQIVKCKIDYNRRKILTIHHTAIHILLAACRKVLGKHVWQVGAEKDVDKARLDISHFEKLSEEEIEKIEKIANEIVKSNLKIEKMFVERNDAEKMYGFKIYQGGYVPEKIVRIVKIGDIDVEACSGTHCNSTKEVEIIKIINTKKIADGVIRLEIVAGEVAIEFLRRKEKILEEICNFLNCSEEEAFKKVKELFELWKKKRK